MKKHIRCPACGRSRKPSHEKRCKTPKAYSPNCISYTEFDYELYKKEMMEVIKKQEEKAAREKAIKEAQEKEVKIQELAKSEAKAKVEAMSPEDRAKIQSLDVCKVVEMPKITEEQASKEFSEGGESKEK